MKKHKLKEIENKLIEKVSYEVVLNYIFNYEQKEQERVDGRKE